MTTSKTTKRRKISPRTRFRVLRRDKFTCRYCGARAPDVQLHVDHIHPQSQGGGEDEGNLVTACADCNQGKRDTLLQAPEYSPDRVRPILYRLFDYQTRVACVGEVVARIGGESATLEEYIDKLDDYRADMDWCWARANEGSVS